MDGWAADRRKYSCVGCDERGSLCHGGGRDDAVRWISRKGFEFGSENSYMAGDRNLSYPESEDLVPPCVYRPIEFKAPAARKHGNFPERNGGNQQAVLLECRVGRCSSGFAKGPVAFQQPHENMCVKDDGIQRKASQRVRMGAMMSRLTEMDPLSAPKSVRGRRLPGTSWATGSPFLVIKTDSPVAATSSMILRHLALNSEALIVFTCYPL